MVSLVDRLEGKGGSVWNGTRVQQPRLALIGEGSSVCALGQQVLVSVLEGS